MIPPSTGCQKAQMTSDNSEYLASRYLVADPKPSTKKRKKKATATEGLIITDDADDAIWIQAGIKNDRDDGDLPLTVSGATAEFRKTRKSKWKSIGKGSTDEDGLAAANAILASTAAENEKRIADDCGMPVLDTSDSIPKMSDGTHAGLQSAAAVSAQIKQRQHQEREEFERHRSSRKEEETVYRDATGRRIDISMRRAHARKAAAEVEEKERLARQALGGKVQMEAMRRFNENLEGAKFLPFARAADDESLNRELREQERWNDPMLQFMAHAKTTRKGKESVGKQPVYAGATPPNRYGIQAGYRWDGVDRSIGFEADRYRAMNRRDRIEDLGYSWQMDE